MVGLPEHDMIEDGGDVVDRVEGDEVAHGSIVCK